MLESSKGPRKPKLSNQLKSGKPKLSNDNENDVFYLIVIKGNFKQNCLLWKNEDFFQ